MKKTGLINHLRQVFLVETVLKLCDFARNQLVKNRWIFLKNKANGDRKYTLKRAEADKAFKFQIYLCDHNKGGG